jgi:VWFA-related protein
LNLPGVRAQAGMAQLAEATGGNSFVPDKLENLDAVFRQITAELRSQYLLQYYSNNDSPGNKFLRIKVATPARSDLRIRAREGYYPKRK